jgi:capsular polysaccharide transport system permease protein
MAPVDQHILNPDASFTQRIGALVRRERATRFSGGAFGYLWAYLTPVAFIALIVVSFRILHRIPPIYVSTELFVATGILPYVLFRQTITAMARTAIANRHLLYFLPVTVTDLFFATALLELLNLIVTVVLIFSLIMIFFGGSPPADVLGVIYGFFMAWALGMGFGRFVSVLGQWSDTLARAVPLMLRPMFWISGIFYTATELPSSAIRILWYNPLFHAIELVREGFFLGYESRISSAWYPASFALVFYLLSLLVERYVVDTRRARHRI